MSERAGIAAGARLGRQPSVTQATYTSLVPTVSRRTASAAGAVRLAWQTTILAFIAFTVVVIGAPVLGNMYVRSAIEPRPAHMTALDGVVFVQRLGTGDWLMVKPEEQIAPGDVVRTASNARAFVRLFDESTVLLYPSSTLRILRSEQGRFHTDKGTLVLDLQQGRARIAIAPPSDPNASFFQLRLPSAQVHLQEGSYSADVSRDVGQVRARLGEATAYTPGGVAVAKGGQRLVVQADQPPRGNQPARQDLVENGLFAKVSPEIERNGHAPAGWLIRDLSEQDPQGIVSSHLLSGAASFTRSGSGHGETLILQSVDADLWDFEKVTLSATIRVLLHSLSGGGWQGSEYPLMLRVTYRDATGRQVPWYRGYYLHNRDNLPAVNGELLPSTDWQHVEIDLLTLVPRPWRIERVEVAAAGWDYTSAIREFHIWAE